MPTPVDTSAEFARGPDGKLTPQGQSERWAMEFRAARDKLKEWHKQGEKVVDRYLDERDRTTAGESRLNLFTSNVESLHSMLYGQTPKCSVSRRFADSADDVGRIAGEMLERLINTDIEHDGASYAVALDHCLEDRLLPGFAFASARYEMETGPATHPETGEPLTGEDGEPLEEKNWENVETDWHYWKSVLWSPCRTHGDSRWYAWCAPLTREALRKRFGDDIGNRVPMNTKTGKKGEADAVKSDPWARADVWEIWSKEDRAVYWYVDGFDRILDEKPDPYGLEDFYPFPAPMIARATTRAFVPRPDFVIAQDIYNEIDVLTTRINLLETAVRVAGLFDKSNPDIVRLLSDAGFNKLYPADNWIALAEKGGLKGMVDWFPLEQVVGAIRVLNEERVQKIGLLQQVTGWSDIMRGQSNASETLGAQQLKTRFGGIRVERLQKEFAAFASGLLKIKGEIIAKHYDVETIIERSNALNTPDAKDKNDPQTGQPMPGSGLALIQQAAQLIKSRIAEYRIEVKPEAISLTDFAQMKEERVEVVGALAQLFSAAQPVLASVGPGAAPFFLELGKWVISGTKGSSEMEGIFDRFAEQAQQMAMAPKPPPPPDPRLQTAQVKGQAEMGKAQLSLVQTQAETRRDLLKAEMDIQLKQLEHQTQMERAQAEANAGPEIPGGE